MSSGSITKLLQEAAAGVAGAEDRLLALVYDELRAMAARRVSNERCDGATDLVHDAYARLAGADFENRRHLFFAYARAMEQILIERARRERALKHGGQRGRVPLDQAGDAAARDDRAMVLDAMDVKALLERLADQSPRQAQVVTLRYFGGLSDADIAEILGVDPRTVRREWAAAKTIFASWWQDG